VEVVRSTARYRILCAGRRSGKTRVYGVLALHGAFSRPGFKVLIVSASDVSAKRMFADVLGMVTGALQLRSSVDDDTTHLLTLSNGSTIECVPSSMKAVRSAEADLLIVDEAGFVDQDIWEAAEPVVGARPGARVLVGSTPWRGPGHFFHDLWRQGMDRPDAEVASCGWRL
jgi:tRNA(Met) C34 N-acetyltransferase TmcA